MKFGTEPGNKNRGRNQVIVIILGAIVIIAVISGFRSMLKKIDDEWRAEETRKFEEQFKQDPSTWNKEQQDRYYNFIEWTGSQD